MNCLPSGKYVHLLYMYSILGRGSFYFNYCLNSARHGGDQFVALLRWYGSPGFFDSGLQLICIVGSGSLHLLYFLRKLRRARAPTPIMCTFYRGTIESILTSCITVWYGTCNASCRKSLQRIVRAAEKIIGVSLPSLQDIYSTRLTRKDLCIAGDPTHPSHSFFSLLPSGRRLRSLQARTSRLKDSFIHQAVRKLNSLPSLPPTPSFTPRNTELWHYDRPPPQLPTSPHPHIPRTPPPPPLTNCDPHQSLCAALDWSLPHPALTVNYLFWQSYKRLFFFLHHTYICTVLFYLTGLHSICHVPYATLSISFLFFYNVLICISV